MKMEKEKQLVARYRQALYYAACDYSMTKTDCSKCNCRESCKHNPATLGCRFALEDRWKRDAGIEDNQGADDAPTYPQEQLADLEEKEKRTTAKVTNCSKCCCRDLCERNPNTVGCALALRRLADVKRREAVDHPAYYKAGGVEAIDVIEAWGIGFCLGNTVKYIARCGRKSENAVEDLKKAAWYLNREIERKEKEDSRNE